MNLLNSKFSIAFVYSDIFYELVALYRHNSVSSSELGPHISVTNIRTELPSWLYILFTVLITLSDVTGSNIFKRQRCSSLAYITAHQKRSVRFLKGQNGSKEQKEQGRRNQGNKQNTHTYITLLLKC